MRRDTENALFFVAVLAVILFPIARRFVRDYIRRPLRLRRRGMSATPDYVPFNPADLPEAPAKALAQASRQFAECGFRAIDHLTSRDVAEGATTYLSLWRHDDCNDIASILILFVAGPRPRTVCIASMDRDFTDGSSLSVTTARFPRVEPPGSPNRYIHLPDVWDLATLWQVHRRWAEQETGDRVAQVIAPEQLAAYIANDARARLERMAAYGWCRLNPQDGRYYYTFRGTLWQVWPHLWPFKDWFQWRDRRNTERALRSLGYGGITDVLARQRPLVHDEAGERFVRVGGFPVVGPRPVQSVTPASRPVE